MLKRHDACSDLLVESKFETLQIGIWAQRSMSSQLSAKLRKTFDVPPTHTEPPAIRELLRRIEAKFDERH